MFYIHRKLMCQDVMSIFSLASDTDDELATNIIIDDVTGVLQVLVPFDNFTNVTSGSMADPFSITVTLIVSTLSFSIKGVELRDNEKWILLNL